MKTNRMNINDISQFSDLSEVALATTGKYGKYSDKNYRITIISDVVFVHTWATTTLEIPSHYTFKFMDESGIRTVDEETKEITVYGPASFNFVYRNTDVHTNNNK